MRFLFLESFYGGSHRDFADGLVRFSRYRIDLFTLPARFWKWRMRGAALHFAHEIDDPTVYDGLIVTDLISLSDLKSLWGAECPPALVYFHENQLSYPLPEGKAMDYQFGFTDITTAMAAERILFNSHTHRESFFKALPGFIRMMPEFRPLWVVQVLERKAGVLYPGCHFPSQPVVIDERDSGPPIIVWNHRWEFDKCPDVFFQVLDGLVDEGREFRIVLMGENFQVVPKPFLAARERYGERILQYGYVPSKEEYFRWLQRGDIVVSTAIQENFGISIVEAVRCGCFPLLPTRLSYPELIPRKYHPLCLYADREDLKARLARFLTSKERHLSERRSLADAVARYSWESTAVAYDEELEELAAARGSGRGT